MRRSSSPPSCPKRQQHKVHPRFDSLISTLYLSLHSPHCHIHSIPTLTPTSSSSQTLPPFRDAKKPQCAENLHEFQIGGLLFVKNVLKYHIAVATTQRKHVGRIGCFAGLLRLFCPNVYTSFVIQVRLVLGGEHFSPSAKVTCTRSGGEALTTYCTQRPFVGGP